MLSMTSGGSSSASTDTITTTLITTAVQWHHWPMAMFKFQEKMWVIINTFSSNTVAITLNFKHTWLQRFHIFLLIFSVIVPVYCTFLKLKYKITSFCVPIRSRPCILTDLNDYKLFTKFHTQNLEEIFHINFLTILLST